MNKLVKTYYDIDDLYQLLITQWQQKLIEDGQVKRCSTRRKSAAEIMTIIIHFHQSHYRDFQSYYLHDVSGYLRYIFRNC